MCIIWIKDMKNIVLLSFLIAFFILVYLFQKIEDSLSYNYSKSNIIQKTKNESNNLNLKTKKEKAKNTYEKK